MLEPKEILNRLIFITGTPRSGTTYSAKSLSSYPKIMAAINNHVYECWGLYHYPGQMGLVSDLNAIPADRCFIYNHATLRTRTEKIFKKLAVFLGVEFSGFQTALNILNPNSPKIPSKLVEQQNIIKPRLNFNALFKKLESINTGSCRSKSPKD